MKQLMPEYSKKKLTKACEILKMISENPNISIEELRIALDVTDRTIARYISELKDKGIIERKGPDNGGKWEIRQVNDSKFGTQCDTQIFTQEYSEVSLIFENRLLRLT